MSTDEHELITDIREIIFQSRSLTRRSINSFQVISNYLIGRRIVLEEQGGQERADYGKSTLKELSAELTKEFGRGYSRSNLEYMRKFYLIYSPNLKEKSQTLSGISKNASIMSSEPSSQKTQIVYEALSLAQIGQILSVKLPLSWSHYLFLMGISNHDERRFYEVESANQNWSLRELKRQFDSSLYERLAFAQKIQTVVVKKAKVGRR